jgi:uncharacterized protein YmfQ (DUF2313 family)
MGRLDEKIMNFINDLDLFQTIGLLEQWESVVGLPDETMNSLAGTLIERRSDIVRKIRARGGLSIAYMISMAKVMGYTITIDEHRFCRSGIGRCGDAINGTAWLYWYEIKAEEATIIAMTSGVGRSGDPLRTWRVDTFENYMMKIKPAHMNILFTYEA